MKRTRVERGIYRQQNGTYGVYLLVDGKPRFKTVGSKLAEARRQQGLLQTKAGRGASGALRGAGAAIALRISDRGRGGRAGVSAR